MNITKNADKKKERFLEILRASGNITRAARAVNLSRFAVYNWREKDLQFAQDWDNALEEACDHLEHEARRRAFTGWNEPVFHKGGQCGVVRKYSDTLLIFLLKGNRPDKYKDRVEQDQKGAIDLNVTVTYEKDRKTQEEEAG